MKSKEKNVKWKNLDAPYAANYQFLEYTVKYVMQEKFSYEKATAFITRFFSHLMVGKLPYEKLEMVVGPTRVVERPRLIVEESCPGYGYAFYEETSDIIVEEVREIDWVKRTYYYDYLDSSATLKLTIKEFYATKTSNSSSPVVDPLLTAIINMLHLRNIQDITINPEALKLIHQEAEVMDTDNIEWVIRSILGKSSRDGVTNNEIKQLINKAEVEPTIMLYSPVLRPDNVLHPDRLKKDIPIKGGIRIFSPVIGEAIIAELVKDLQVKFNIDELINNYKKTDKRLSIVGKYTGGLIPGLLLAQKLHLPFDTLTKRSFNFETRNLNVVRVEEPHLPIASPEYYSHMVVYPNTGVFVIDDETTKGDVLVNTMKSLESLEVVTEVSIVLLQSTDEAGIRTQRENNRYYAMRCINYEQNLKLDESLYIPFKRLKVSAKHRLFKNSSIEESEIPLSIYTKKDNLSKDAVFVDCPLRGMTMTLESDFYASIAQKINEEIDKIIGGISKRRKEYYAKGKTLYLLGLTPSGLYPALAASMSTRIPLIGVTNQSEPRGYTGKVIDYITLDGYDYSIYNLEQGDGVILVTGEITDGEKQLRVIKSLKDEHIDILGVISVLENIYYNGRKLIEEIVGTKVISLQKHSHNEGLFKMNFTEKVWSALKYAVRRLDREIKEINPESEIVKIQVMPCSFTRGLILKNGDIDNMFIYINGLNQLELRNLGSRFVDWLKIKGFSLFHFVFDTNEKAPVLISTNNLRAGEIKYEVNDIPQVVIYQN
ncbi:MAG: hypothetical protein NC820_08125, partial [Candidatus Omnitrophica bacterium]|nr:hypothetical protein [Candidatus Omnitrophota bacterium]